MSHNRPSSKRLGNLLQKIDGAYAPNTIRAFRADFEEFIAFCKSNKARALPASPETVAAFVDETTKRNIASASIRRKIVSIGSVHRLLELTDPTKAGCVKLALRKMHRSLGRACKQAHPINQETLEKMLSACKTQDSASKLIALRDKVLLMIAYDTLARRSELVSLRFEDLEHSHTNAGIYLRKSKVDQEGRGRWLPISQKTLNLIKAWQEIIDVTNGPIIRAINAQGFSDRLGAGQVGRILKKLAKKANLPECAAKNISGHSLRVGAAQDWAVKGISLPQLMVMGGWEKPDTVMRYIGKARVSLEGLRL